MKRVYVIVLNWNGWRDTISCLESLFRQTSVSYRVVVCDNASTDGSIAYIEGWAQGNLPSGFRVAPPAGVAHHPVPRPISYVVYDRREAEAGGRKDCDPEMVLIQTGSNLGFAGGNNVGIRYALQHLDAQYFWLLNNDTFADPAALSALVSRADTSIDIGIVGSTLRYFDRPECVQAYGGATFSPILSRSRPIGEGESFRLMSAREAAELERRMGYVIGASMLVTRPFVEQIGLMQEDYFLYYEELDWAVRAKRHRGIAFKLGYAPGSIVYHKVGASAGSKTRSLASLQYLHRNELRFMKRFYPALAVITRVSFVLSAIKAMLKGRREEAKLFVTLAWRRVEV